MGGCIIEKQKIFHKHFFLAEQERTFYSTWCKKNNLTFEQLQILSYLCETKDGVEIGIMADALTIPRQTMTHMLDIMETKEWLSRRRTANDRRKIFIFISAQGAHLFSILNSKLWMYEEAVMDTITMEELEVFNDVYSRIVHGLTQKYS